MKMNPPEELQNNILSLPLTWSAPAPLFSRGTLVSIGGGIITEAILKKILKLSGEEHARLVLIPAASDFPLETATAQKLQFEELGAQEVKILHCTKETVDEPQYLDLIKQATCIFFCGGDQRKLASTLSGSKLLELIYRFYHCGGIIAGTSAGAAVMSRVMLTGGSRSVVDPTLPYPYIRSQNVEFAEGLGFLEGCIIDQHFSRRGRHNRLLSLLLEHPDLLGIGIDESTAIIISPDHMLEVVGESHILIFDAASAHHIHVDNQQNMSASNILLQILCAGDRYDLARRQVYTAAVNTSPLQK